MKTIIGQCETESKQRKAMSGKQQQERETNHMATENEQQTTRSAQCKTKSDEIQAGGLGGAAPPALYNFLNKMESKYEHASVYKRGVCCAPPALYNFLNEMESKYEHASAYKRGNWGGCEGIHGLQ